MHCPSQADRPAQGRIRRVENRANEPNAGFAEKPIPLRLFMGVCAARVE
jgi:hypothetical protein